MQNVQTSPVVGQSVFVPFRTGEVDESGKIGYIKGGALQPFDKIDAVYSDTEYSRDGKKKVFSVRLKSGDQVKIIAKDDKWQAVA